MIDAVAFRCQVKEEHKIHVAECDVLRLGKHIRLSWGAGKPKIVELPLTVNDLDR